LGLVRERLRDAEGDQVDAEWSTKLDETRAQFEEGMNDDFNTPRAIAALFDLSHEVNAFLNSDQPASRATLEAIHGLYRSLGGDVLGIRFDDKIAGAGSETDADLVDALVRMLIEVRQQAREARDWSRADAVRDQLAGLGVLLEDGAEGTRWRLSR
jgi:cysteinyl-tRNA synthetase